VKQSERALKKAIADELLGFFWGQLVQSRRANPKAVKYGRRNHSGWGWATPLFSRIDQAPK
jgi:hypothetical protein